jgi:hypothetical protein
MVGDMGPECLCDILCFIAISLNATLFHEEMPPSSARQKSLVGSYFEIAMNSFTLLDYLHP